MDQNISILIVDDVGTVRSFLHQTLMHLGIDHVREASTATQCVKLCEEQHFDIV
ncbi:two-component system response regulator, partial [Pseudoalteromonas sp. S3178]